MTTLRWRLMFRVTTHEEAAGELARAETMLALPLHVTRVERYWKIPELWSCDATVAFEASSIADGVTQSLLLANRLAIGWYVLGPYLTDDGTLESFEGIYAMQVRNHVMALLEWAHFELVVSVSQDGDKDER